MKNKLKAGYSKLLKIKRKIKNKLYGHKRYNKFVIISRSRTGSTFLMALLNNHENIICEGELFQRLNGKSCKQIWSSFFNVRAKNIKLVGFKLFYYHPFDKDKSVWEFILNDKNITIIHLIRNNKLRALVSKEIADKTNKWSEYSTIKQTIGIEDKRVTLDYNKCLKVFEEIAAYEDKTRKQFANHNFIEVNYENLAIDYDKVINDITNKLGVKYQKVEAKNKKQNAEPLEELVINFHELKDKFSNSKWEYLFMENEN